MGQLLFNAKLDHPSLLHPLCLSYEAVDTKCRLLPPDHMD